MERSESKLRLVDNEQLEQTGEAHTLKKNEEYPTEELICHFTPSNRPEKRQIMVFREHRNSTSHVTFPLPEFCDVELIVGKKKVPIYGIKAVMACRSRVFFNKFLSSEKTNISVSGRRIRVMVPDYHPEVIRRLVQYIHNGTIQINTKVVVGLYCAAEEFDIAELRLIFSEYFRLNATWRKKTPILMEYIHFYGNKNGVSYILQKIMESNTMKTLAVM